VRLIILIVRVCIIAKSWEQDIHLSLKGCPRQTLEVSLPIMDDACMLHLFYRMCLATNSRTSFHKCHDLPMIITTNCTYFFIFGNFRTIAIA